MLSNCRSGAPQTGVKWTVGNVTDGLCVPTSMTPTNTNPTTIFNSLEECQQFARPQGRQIYWNVANSSGYMCDGQIGGVCRATLNYEPDADNFTSGTACASSDRARYTAYPNPTRPRGWICTHPTLGQCVETQNVNVPFTYKVYKTYEECTTAPENNIDSSQLTGCLPPLPTIFSSSSWATASRSPRVASQRASANERWYIDSDTSKCEKSYLSTAPFDTRTSCGAALSVCNASAQPALQFSNPVQSTDSQLGIAPLRQVPLNPPDRVPIIGTQQIVPGLAGQGYGIY